VDFGEVIHHASFKSHGVKHHLHASVKDIHKKQLWSKTKLKMKE
jgi:hypothetical protein